MSTFLRTIEFLCLSLWLGSDVFLSFMVAPGAFRILSSRDQAGAIVGYSLTRMHLVGIACGIVLLLARLLRSRMFASLLTPAALTGAPHVPRGDGAVGTPAFAEGQEFLGRGHLLFAVSDGPALSDAEVVDGENVGSAQAEDQKHFDGPGADAADRDEALDEFFVGVLFGLFEGGDDPFDGFPGAIFHGEDFCAGEDGLAEDRFAER